MSYTPPDHCHRCGQPVEPVDPPTVHRCDACAEYVFHNPSPNCRVAVLDGDRVLLVEIDDAHRLGEPPADGAPEWMTPGGHLEIGEQPAVAAARELEEETGVVADPGDLELFDAVVREVIAGAHGLILLYAVERAATTGTVEAGSDAAGARFWGPAELGGAEDRFREMHAEPARYRDLSGWVRRARATLGTTRERVDRSEQ